MGGAGQRGALLPVGLHGRFLGCGALVVLQHYCTVLEAEDGKDAWHRWIRRHVVLMRAH